MEETLEESEPSSSHTGDTTHNSHDPIKLVLALQRAAASEEQEGLQCSEQADIQQTLMRTAQQSEWVELAEELECPIETSEASSVNIAGEER